MTAPDKLKQLEVKFRLAWTHGTLPDLVRVLVLVLALAGGGVWLGWDRIAQVLSSAPVWAFIAFLGMSCFTSHAPAIAANWSPEATSHFSCVSSVYDKTRGISQCPV